MVDVKNFLTAASSSAIASAMAELFTFPLDLTKTRLQIQGEVASNGKSATLVKRGMWQTACSVAYDEGLTQLWRGVQPAIYRQIVYTGIRMSVYEQLRENVLHRGKDGSFSVWKAIVSGSCAGAISQLIVTPLDLVKVQMQTELAQKARGNPPKYRNVSHGLKTIMKSGGVKSLWTGWGPSVQRAALVNIGNLTIYDIAKQGLLRNTNINDTWFCHMCASICSGLGASILSTPADVIKTRIMNQTRDKNGKGLYYKSAYDCLLKTIRQEGFFSLYKGFLPTWSRIGPWATVFWVTNEEIRKLLGMSTF